MTIIVSVVNLTLLGWVTSQSIGLQLAAESVTRGNEAVAADGQMHLAIKNERIFQRVDYT